MLGVGKYSKEHNVKIITITISMYYCGLEVFSFIYLFTYLILFYFFLNFLCDSMFLIKNKKGTVGIRQVTGTHKNDRNERKREEKLQLVWGVEETAYFLEQTISSFTMHLMWWGQVVVSHLMKKCAVTKSSTAEMENEDHTKLHEHYNDWCLIRSHYLKFCQQILMNINSIPFTS